MVRKMGSTSAIFCENIQPQESARSTLIDSNFTAVFSGKINCELRWLPIETVMKMFYEL